MWWIPWVRQREGLNISPAFYLEESIFTAVRTEQSSTQNTSIKYIYIQQQHLLMRITEQEELQCNVNNTARLCCSVKQVCTIKNVNSFSYRTNRSGCIISFRWGSTLRERYVSWGTSESEIKSQATKLNHRFQVWTNDPSSPFLSCCPQTIYQT